MSEFPDARDEGSSPSTQVPEAGSICCDDPEFQAIIHGLSALEGKANGANADTPKDHLADLRNCILVIQQRAAALRQQIDQAFVNAIEAHGPIEVGTIRYVISVDRTTRCRDAVATADCVLEATGGDFGRFCEMLVSQPFKPASVRAILAPESYESCFEVVQKKNVEGEAVEKLRKVDTRFRR